MFSVQCLVSTVRRHFWTGFSVCCSFHDGQPLVQCTLYTVHCTLCTVHCALYTTCIVYTVHYLHSLPYTCSVKCGAAFSAVYISVLCRVHSSVDCSVQGTEHCSVHCSVQDTEHCSVHCSVQCRPESSNRAVSRSSRCRLLPRTELHSVPLENTELQCIGLN